MSGLGFQEIVVVALVALIVIGPDRLPEFARQAGKMLARFRQETSKSVAELKRAADIQDLDRELKSLSRDLRDVSSSVSKALLAEPQPKPVSTGGPSADDAPPPIDPDAT